MATVTMLVSLKIPDATALTALRTLHEMGYKELKGLQRATYYEFEYFGDEKKFKDAISKVDILVNANKHLVAFGKPKQGVSIAVTDNEQGDGLKKTLKERLGITQVQSVTQGTLWTFDVSGKKQEDLAKKMTEELLANVHYQSYRVVE